jgi:hypothetical protein
MIFGISHKAKLPPLTAFCTYVSDRTVLPKLADSMTAGGSSAIDNRAIVLSLVVMAAAGSFVKNLRSGQGKITRSLRRYLRDTNLDVITAEGIIWIHFLMGTLWKRDQGNDHEMYKRIGRVTFFMAGQVLLYMIKEQTGFDFQAKATESRKFYLDALKNHWVSYEPFATIVSRSVGRRSLAEPLKIMGPLEFPAECPPLATNLRAFMSTTPPAYYETFKIFLKERSDRFPNDKDSDEQIEEGVACARPGAADHGEAAGTVAKTSPYDDTADAACGNPMGSVVKLLNKDEAAADCGEDGETAARRR